MSATLSLIEIRFLQRLASGGVTNLATSRSAGVFHANFHLGTESGSRYVYQPADWLRAGQLLSSMGVDHAPLPPGSFRSDATTQGAASEKVSTLRPHADSIPVKPVAGTCMIDGKPLVLAPDSYMVVPSATALRIQATRLLLVDNAETFRRLERYRWINYGGHNVLAIYRGDNWFKQSETLAMVNQRSESVWCFYDFDPEGLGRAATQARLERVVLPKLDLLETAVRRHNRRDLFDSNVRAWRPTLDACVRPLIATPWALMKALRRGLPQEIMEKMESTTPP